MLKIIDLGKTEYQEVLKIQLETFERIYAGKEIFSHFFITEHKPVYTAGKTTKKEDIKDTGNIPVFWVDRGGSVTFHGEGQIVVYPVLMLKNRISVKKYVYTLESIIIDTLDYLGIKAHRKEKLRGVFTDKGKIGSIGVKISRGITMHGFSVNVDVNKSYFEKIVPCGIKNIPVCNISDFKRVDLTAVKLELIKSIIKKGRDLI